MERSDVRVLLAFGTRPEVIKLSPVVAALRRRMPPDHVFTLSTGQQSALLAQTLATFSLEPDFAPAAVPEGSELASAFAHLLTTSSRVLRQLAPTLVVVQGDTLSTCAAALAAFYARCPVIHVEAGLRTHDVGEPFPEEMHRQAVTRIASLHLAPTEQARENLRAEGIDDGDIVVTGNTGQDALRQILPHCRPPSLPTLAAGTPYAVATVHRRDSIATVSRIAAGLARGARESGLALLVVLHPNPHLSAPLREALGGVDGVTLCEPLTMDAMVGLCRGARVVVTDSGGLQEEATALGVPCLVLRGRTDRPESVEAGAALVVGTEERDIAAGMRRVATDEGLRRRMAQARDIFGDGRAAERCADAILGWFERPGTRR